MIAVLFEDLCHALFTRSVLLRQSKFSSWFFQDRGGERLVLLQSDLVAVLSKEKIQPGM